ncbi:MAG: L-histidine N(alpha)-methyltransferase [Rhodospirillales bacterium]|nr:L-histidine N(alpha)-methyltransferase [Rhodospirillales bacterium]
MRQMAYKQHDQIINPAFQKDVCDFFAERRSGHIGHWRYSEPLFPGDHVNGIQHWRRFIEQAKNGSDYYIYGDEISVIQNFMPQIGMLIPKSITAIELGPGSKDALEQKTLVSLRSINKVVSYVGVDISESVLENAEQIISREMPHISFHAINQDFFRKNLTFPVTGMPVMMMFGQTMFNLPISPFSPSVPKEILTGYLAHFKSHLGNTGYFVVTQDTNQDADNLYSAYIGEKVFAENLLHRIIRDLPVSEAFNPAGFLFEPFWVPETKALAHTFVCLENMKFTIGDEAFYIKQGQRLCFHNTYKFSDSAFLSMAMDSDFVPVSSFDASGGCVKLHVLKAT